MTKENTALHLSLMMVIVLNSVCLLNDVNYIQLVVHNIILCYSRYILYIMLIFTVYIVKSCFKKFKYIEN